MLRAAVLLAKGTAIVFATMAFFMCFLGWYLFGWPAGFRRAEDPGFAADLFSGHLPVQQVLASRKWHVKGGQPWDCTYAIVRLDDGLPEEPLSWRDKEKGWQFRFGGNWLATPAAELSDNTRNALEYCGKYWPQSLAEELSETIGQPGSWYVRDPSGETFFLYSQERRLAARVRYGD